MSVAYSYSRRPAATTAAGRSFRAVDARRRLQIALGLVWLVDGALQLQPFMFTRSFVTQIVAPNTAGQPGFVAWPIKLAEHLIEPRVALFNAFAAALQIAIGLGLLYRPAVKVALAGSLAWALSVWWIGEGLGGLFTGDASPLTGAPGPALLYAFAAVLLWPATADRVRGGSSALAGWMLLWVGSAVLWLLPANRSPASTHDQIVSAPSGAGWLSRAEANVAGAAGSHGLLIAITAAAVSAAIGISMLRKRAAPLSLVLTAALALVYLVVGQGLGGVLTGTGTDPGSGPLLALLAFAVYALRYPCGYSRDSADM